MARLNWTIHTPGLLTELFSIPLPGILGKPISIFAATLAKVAERASELNDPILNELMCRLTLYECADPYSAEYDPKRLAKVRALAKKEARMRSREMKASAQPSPST